MTLLRNALLVGVLATFAAVALLLDRGVEAIVEAMREVGAYENSILVFASDNGGTLAQTGGGSN